MKRDAAIREKISKKVYEECGKKVRSVFFLCGTKDDRYCYCLVGNNDKIFGTALVDERDNIEVHI